MIFKGRCISRGVARGPAILWDSGPALASALKTRPSGPPAFELERLNAAIGRACVQLNRIRRQVAWRATDHCEVIFDTHASLLRDAAFVDRIEHAIVADGQSAESAVSQVVGELHSKFSRSQTPLVHEKAADILDIGWRLIRCLSTTPAKDDAYFAGKVILAILVTPSEFVYFVQQGAVAVVTESCGAKSHTAILARGLGIPLVTGVSAASDILATEVEVLVDADSGTVVVEPDQADPVVVRPITDRLQHRTVGRPDPVPPVTADGVSIELLLNISIPAEAAAVRLLGAAGVGLFRTEFLYMDCLAWPSEDQSYAAYRRVASEIQDAELNIRLADFGAEKCPPYADIPVNRNPSLGLRGLRLLLQREDILRPQLCAISRLARERPLTVLLPMLDTVDCLHGATNKVCRILGCKDRHGLPFKLGTMIEVPSAALQVDEILPYVESIALGLNDLTQYLLAADRDDELVEGYHDALQPTVLRLTRAVVESAGRAGKPVTVCGELAGDPTMTAPLLALGVRRLSVSQSMFQDVVEAIRRVPLGSLDDLADRILSLESGEAVRKVLAEELKLYK